MATSRLPLASPDRECGPRGKLDWSRGRCPRPLELSHERDDARADLDRLRFEASWLRDRADEADCLGGDLQAERARTDPPKIETRQPHGADSPPEAEPPVAMPEEPGDVRASGSQCLEEGQDPRDDGPGPSPQDAPADTTHVPGPEAPTGSRYRDDPPSPSVQTPEGAGSSVVDLEIPGYEILGMLREGAMGRVFKARQMSVDRIVAIKLLRHAFARDEEYTQRFWREALIGAQLSHPNLITILDAGEVDGHPYLVMESVDGETVQDQLDKRRLFGDRATIEIALAVAEALRHAHHRGMVHRDVKPANVILTPDGVVKLADLGLARPIGDDGWALAEAGMAVGTPEYISPEQVRGQFDVDIRSDIYSLGATLYHMVTGQVPYGEGTTSEAMRKHVDPQIPLLPPESLKPGLTSGLGAVIEKMMARNREERYRHPDDLIVDLGCLLRGDRPILAEQAPDAWASLAVGDVARIGAGSVPASGLAGDDRSWGFLIIAPALLLAILLIGTLVLLAVR